MMLGEIMQVIPPEQWGVIVTALGAIILAILAAVAFLVRWGVRYFARVQDEKLNAMRQEREIEKADFEARLKERDREWELRLAQSNSKQESERLFFSELRETSKEDNARFNLMQDAFRKQDENHARQSQETIEAFKGIQANTAATLELLKTHALSDEILGTKQDRLMKQGDEANNKLIDLASSLDTVIKQVDNLASSRISDRKILEDIHGTLVLIQTGIKRLEEKPNFDDTANLANGAKQLSEENKEFSGKTPD